MSELELEVMSSCLVRQGREGEKGIRSLQANLRFSEANLRFSEARIKVTYREVSIQQQGYFLHTMMVHNGQNWEYQHYRGDI